MNFDVNIYLKKISTYVKISLRKLKDGDYMTVADRIRQKREELHLSQEELARKIGNKDKSTISKIEKSGNDISMKNIKRISEALGVSSQYLMGWEESSKELRKEIIHNEFLISEAKLKGNKELLKELQEKGDYLSYKYSQQYDNYLATKFEDNSEKEEKTQKALELYDKIEKADPNIREAILSLLKGVQ